MSYTVQWRPSAEQQLTQLWMSAADRSAVAAVADQIDSLLEREPLSAGEARSGNTRLLFLPPLAVYYDVHQTEREVFVWAVWRYGKP